MKYHFLTLVFFGAFTLSNCSIEEENINKKVSNHLIMDSHTLSNYKDLPIIHTHLDLEVDFVNKLLRGSVTHKLSEDRNTDLLVLDSKHLEVDSVKDERGNRLNFEIGNFDELLGSKFSIQLNKESKSVTIFYKTTNKSEALDWLMPNQTAGKNFPFMYTQGQSIFTRSWIPIQDTPGLRITYSANIKTPENMMAVMSAANPQEQHSENSYNFEMKQPIPPYLIALAVGNLQFKAVDYNGVIALLIEAVKELNDKCNNCNK